ncbi:CPBP family intramembrane glutamic endopeptidase [Allonocardiopsis opalescens]|uniref:CAAX prenyl protease-like protein n=1 Tax=Allonocardiopsis opalescens TaxID=1144618 RepID=A0A2T0Q329_9ACTN|nr:CPBP family intramembrane glutamic endopeptidase [Allonocardiopsis opalescens]PRX98078.1 CAAX prenyl protease-like protein [Allonocardiopsis opalescens]
MTDTTRTFSDDGPDPAVRPRVEWRGIALFVALAMGGAWLAMLPLLISGFQRTGTDLAMGVPERISIAVMMFTPAIAAVVALVTVHRRRSLRALRTSLGLVLPGSPGALARQILFAAAVPVAIQLAILCLCALAGTYRFDLADFSGFRSQFAPDTMGAQGVPWAALAGWALALLPALLVSLPQFFGEELGWQGYLLPKLAPLGVAPALIGTGAVFALWHGPTLVMGGQYPGVPWPMAVGMMLVSTVLLLPILAWLRMRSGSVWPAVVAHTMISTVCIQLTWVLADADAPFHPLTVGMTSWLGWVVMGGFTAFLALTGRLRFAAPTAKDAAP